MDFQSINLLNVRLNLLSGNLLPMSDNLSFSIFWKIYSVFVWLLELVYTITLIPACFLVPKEKALNDGIVPLVVIAEAVFMIMRIHGQTALVRLLIRQLNKTLGIEDENMRNIVTTNLKPMEIPFKCYLTIGLFSASFWCCMSLPLAFEKNIFYYVDFKTPAIYSKEPFSVGVFMLGSMIGLVSNIFIFLKKISVDVYTTHLISLITVQYQYVASRLVLIFRNSNPQDNSIFRKNNSRVDSSIENEIKILCWQHITAIYKTLMLKKLLSLNIFLIYVNNVLRFCFLGIMLTKISESFLEGCMVIMYGSGSIVQFYILCSCIQKLSEASMELTDEAFHEDWNRFSLSIKRTFLLMIMSSTNLEVKLSIFERFNLSLPAFMAVLNQAYSIALLILRVK